MHYIEMIIATESSKVSEHTLTCFWNLFKYSMYSDDFIIRQSGAKEQMVGQLGRMVQQRDQ